VIHREVVRDSEEPGRDRHLAPFEAIDRLDHLHEGLVGEVLGVVLVADAHLQVAVDPVEVKEVELLEGLAVTLLGALDERAHVFGL
jgi:hypothetical protein